MEKKVLIIGDGERVPEIIEGFEVEGFVVIHEPEPTNLKIKNLIDQNNTLILLAGSSIRMKSIIIDQLLKLDPKIIEAGQTVGEVERFVFEANNVIFTLSAQLERYIPSISISPKRRSPPKTLCRKGIKPSGRKKSFQRAYMTRKGGFRR